MNFHPSAYLLLMLAGRSVIPKLFWFADHLEKFGGPRRTKFWFFIEDSRTTSAHLADHQWSAEQTLGITGVDVVCFLHCINKSQVFGGSNFWEIFKWWDETEVYVNSISLSKHWVFIRSCCMITLQLFKSDIEQLVLWEKVKK